MARFILLLSILTFLVLSTSNGFSQDIPLPEHPRPDFQREQWQNLNGEWNFAFDPDNIGMQQNWESGEHNLDQKIMVPFPWGSELSQVDDEADIAWYQREITVDESWKNKRTFIHIGASDWQTDVWIDGVHLGRHEGGYVPFSFELSDHLKYGQAQSLVIRVDDARRDFTLYGKQGYGNARGIWQTVYLEARGQQYLEALHITPDIDNEKIKVTAYLPEPAKENLALSLQISGGESPLGSKTIIGAGKHKMNFEIDIPNPKLWDLDNPHLYELEATLEDDVVNTYFGMRKISVVNLPGTDYPYIALNNQPIYMQLALDQSYHPEGFYTFPSDQFMREEIERSKSIGLNGIRTHIKVEVPRKLYWADKLGLLVMEDLPNSWGEPDELMQAESEYTLREMIKRDYNHPSIFSWVVFNETWGLVTNIGKDEKGRDKRAYLPETQDWVASMYYLAKSLDQTRLVEDNSICCGRGHTETDINSWHAYLPGWAWDEHISEIVEKTFPGSPHHFEDGFTQGSQPNINSECGNVWGYDGSSGDVDWSWDYHRMMNSFRRFPKIAGWLYTEHHDVINEWNGYWRFDRSEKETGMGEIVDGMSLKDLHSPVYVSMGNEICKDVKGGQKISIPMFLSTMTGEDLSERLTIEYDITTTNYIGETEKNLSGSFWMPYKAWAQEELDPLSFTVPDLTGIATIKLKVKDGEGNIVHRNFMYLNIESDKKLEKVETLEVATADFSNAKWSKKQWNVLDGKKANGAGEGYFEYSIPLIEKARIRRAKEVYFLIEVSAKELFVKDQEQFDRNKDYMKGSKAAPSANPNSYPMTDETMFPSQISISINGNKVMNTTLADDPADHRGVLSWHSQLKDRKLREAGSYGYLIKVPVKKSQLRDTSELKIRLETVGEGGIAVYGKEFGRYPLNPTLVLKY